MLYWICPECGHECSPAIRECPTCTAAEKAAPSVQSSSDLLTLAQNFEPAPLLNTASYRNLVSATNGHAAPVAAAVIDDEDTVELVVSPADRARLAAAKLASAEIASMVEPLVESAKPEEPEASYEMARLDGFSMKPSRPAIAEPVKPVVVPTAPRSAAPALVAAKILQADSWLKPAGLSPIGDLAFHPAPGRMPQAHEQQAEPAPSRRRSVAFVRGAMPGGEKSELGMANFAPAGDARLQPVTAANAEAEAKIAPVDPKPEHLAFVASKLQLGGESLVEILRALELSAEELERSAIRAIQSSFEQKPATLLLGEPLEIVTAPAPPSEQWMRSPKLVFTAREPDGVGRATLSAGPQTPTLAGPCLPPQLRNFTEHLNANRRRTRKRVQAPTWMISVLVAIVLFLGAGSLLQYLTANRDAKVPSVVAASNAAEEPAPSLPALPVAREHPGARFIEVAGVRVVTAANKRPQLQYIVINHSAGELTGLNIHIAVHSADSPGGAPLFTISSVIPSLAANQSKEIRTDLDAGLKTASIPDWQSLRPEILIARQ